MCSPKLEIIELENVIISSRVRVFQRLTSPVTLFSYVMVGGTFVVLYLLRLGHESLGTGRLCPTCKTGRFAFSVTYTFRTSSVSWEPGLGDGVKGTG